MKPDLAKLFGLTDQHRPEVTLDTSHLKIKTPERSEGGDFLDLSGQRKVLMAVGPGGTGKTLTMRWACEKGLTSNQKDNLILATVDPVNRALMRYFEGVLSPPGADPATVQSWLSQGVFGLMEPGCPYSMAIDFGAAGEIPLAAVAQEFEGLVQIMEKADLWPVLLVFLSPRTDDLTTLKALNDVGFKPSTTALILNTARVDAGKDPMDAFRRVREHSVYINARVNGAAEIWMPKLHGDIGAAIENRSILFTEAKSEESGFTLLDRSRVDTWLRKMDIAFKPVASWLP